MKDIAGTPRLYAPLDGQQADHQAMMVEIEGKILNTSVSIPIDLGAYQSYVAPKIVDIWKLGKFNHDKPWTIQLATGTKQKFLEIVKECEVKLNGFLMKLNLNILPLGSYDVLIGMD